MSFPVSFPARVAESEHSGASECNVSKLMVAPRNPGRIIPVRKLWIALPVVLLVGSSFLSRPLGMPAPRPIDWKAEPVQEATDRQPFPFETSKGTVTLHPQARFEVSAVVAGTERYRLDGGSFLCPLDLALIWGNLPEEPYADAVTYGQMTRYYFWRTESSDLDLGYIQSHSSNMHLIPATENLRRALFSIDEGDSVRLSGLLVDAGREDGFTWKSSTSRQDEGPGACELVWVEEAQVEGKVYR